MTCARRHAPVARVQGQVRTGHSATTGKGTEDDKYNAATSRPGGTAEPVIGLCKLY